MLTGRTAFDGATAAEILAAVLRDEPGGVAGLAGAVPPALESIVRRCLQKAPLQRYQSARELGSALQALVSAPDLASHALPSLPAGDAPAPKATRSHGAPWTTLGAGRRARRSWIVHAALAGLTLALLAGVGLSLRSRATSRHDDATASATRRVVAVLPFRTISADSTQGYFAAGMAEEIHGQLSKLGELRVLSRQAVERYEGGDVRRMAAELGPVSVITGSVRIDRGRVRITVELVNARTGQTLWSEQYDRELKDLFAVQSDVALRVADTLLAAVSSDERQRIEKRPTNNLVAYDLYLQSEVLPCGDRKAIETLQRAVEMEPDFAVARARMAYHLLCSDDPRLYDLALQHAREAVRTDPALGDAHMALASAYYVRGRAPDARMSFLRALALDPNSTFSMHNLSAMETIWGHHDEALVWASRSFPLAPGHAASYFHVGYALLYLGDDLATERWLAEGERRFPTNTRIQALLAMLDAMRGNMAAALARARKETEGEATLSARALEAELTYLAGTADAEACAERYYRDHPDLQDFFWLLLPSPRVRYVDLLMRRGATDRATRLAAEALRQAEQGLRDGSADPRLPLEIAAVHALRRDNEGALQWLERAFGAGLRDYRTLALQPTFERLRREPRFTLLLSRMSADVAQMRRRANIPQTLSVLAQWPGVGDAIVADQ